ncbi:cupin domain-containing protein [Cobetia marina]|uniref:cupin domain-containing protein n=1 Tax=Cobetia marina TaxID=28258 RepID=UPI0020C7CA12
MEKGFLPSLALVEMSYMRLNADFSQRASITPDHYQWVPSPQGGVERMMLDRIGEEKARATSLVRYAPDSRFSAHEHPQGEEILVLSGTFTEDGVRDFPAGWYLRNPPDSRHTPSSTDGCVIFVKLRQMPSEEHEAVRINTRDPANWHEQDGREICPLYTSATEQVSLQRLAPHAELPLLVNTGGAELLVLEGCLHPGHGSCPAGSWLRLPASEPLALSAGAEGATFYLKTGHLIALEDE